MGMTSRDVARGLAWFGLGVAALLALRAVSRAIGLEGRERLLQLFGVREIASGAIILAVEDPQAWLWPRVAGDVLDALLLRGCMSADNPQRQRTMLATAAAAPVVALDAVHAHRSCGREAADYTPVPARHPIDSSVGFVRYSDETEQVPADECRTIDTILAPTQRSHERTRAEFGEAIRASHAKAHHAKAHGPAVGELTIADDLPEPLAQGVFKPGARYPVTARLASVPGEIDSDAVATQRGLSLMLLGVEGEKMPGHTEAMQDFVLDSGNRFAAGTAARFLLNHRSLEHAPQIPNALKAAVSTLSPAGNTALHHVGACGATLDSFGHSRVHLMAEAHFTQTPIRYGDYIAKLAVAPVAPAQQAFVETAIDHDDPDALRTATVGDLREHDAELEVRVQLRTDRDTMPVEDASAEWPENGNSYPTVARLRLPRQDAFSPARRAYVDDLSFCVSHSLAGHRPLGSIMRARLRAYPVRRDARPPGCRSRCLPWHASAAGPLRAGVPGSSASRWR